MWDKSPSLLSLKILLLSVSQIFILVNFGDLVTTHQKLQLINGGICALLLHDGKLASSNKVYGEDTVLVDSSCKHFSVKQEDRKRQNGGPRLALRKVFKDHTL